MLMTCTLSVWKKKRRVFTPAQPETLLFMDLTISSELLYSQHEAADATQLMQAQHQRSAWTNTLLHIQKRVL